MTIAIVLEPAGNGPLSSGFATAPLQFELQRQFASLDILAIRRTIVSEASLEQFRTDLLRDEVVLVVDGRLIAHTAALRAIAADDRLGAAILVEADPRTAPARGLVVERDTVVAASSPIHEPVPTTWSSVGVIRLDRPACSRVADALGDLQRQEGTNVVLHAFAAGPTELLAAIAVSIGTTLTAVDKRGLVAGRADSDEDTYTLHRRLREVDEDRAWLDASVKATDGWFTTFFVSPYSRFWARRAARWGLTPNQITVASMVLATATAGFFAVGERWAAVVGAVLLQVAFTLDCVDGQLARYTQAFSAYGAWLDSIFDRSKEYIVYLGLAVGAARTGDPGVWALATAAVGLQTMRHSVYLSFESHEPAPARRVLQLRSKQPDINHVWLQPPSLKTGSWLTHAPEATEDYPILRWLKRIVTLPIGERFAVISIAAGLASPRLTFHILLAWGTVAAAATLGARFLLVGEWDQPSWKWLKDPIRRSLEYGIIVGIAFLIDGAAIASFVAQTLLAMQYYMYSYNARIFGSGIGSSLRSERGSDWLVRSAVVIAAGLLNAAATVLWVMAGLTSLLIARNTVQTLGSIEAFGWAHRH